MKTLVFHFPDMCCPVEFGHIEKAIKVVDETIEIVPDYGVRDIKIELKDGFEHLEVDIKAQLDNLDWEYFQKDLTPLLAGKTIFSVPDMDCPVEEAEIKAQFKEYGIEGAVFNVMKRTITVTGSAETAQKARSAIEACGYRAHILKSGEAKRIGEEDHTPWKRYIAALFVALFSEVAELSVEYGAISEKLNSSLEIVSLVLAILAIGMVGLEVFKKGLLSIRHGTLNMNALMAVAVIGGVLIHAWPEAAMVMVLFQISESIEALSMTKARKSIRELMEVAPEVALVKVESGFEETPVDEVGIGSIIRVAPGDRVPLDGKILTGVTTLDQSMVTGESMPAEKAEGDVVWAGTVNLTSTIDVRVTSLASQSLSARIIEAVENAQSSKSQVQRFVDKFAAIYTPLVFVVAILVCVIPPLFIESATWSDWIYRALCILVISCPCALVISTPVTVVSALATATRCGLLVKGGLFLEQARLIKTVGLDKTGTLTKGEPKVSRIDTFSGVSENQAIVWAASLARMNKHPLSKAIYALSCERGLKPFEVKGFTAIAGVGVTGIVAGDSLSLVNRVKVKESGKMTPEIEAIFEKAASQGMSTVALTDFFGVCAVFTLEDEIKEDTKEGLKQLAHEGIRPVLLTGDNEKAAHALADKLGLKDVKANLMPQEKLANIRQMQELGVTAMVGDGINDAPALAQADIGIAMGIRGTDSAIEAADVAVMDDKISSIATLVRLSKMTHSVLVQNIAFALGIKLLFMLLAVSGNATMWMAVFADTGTCLIVVANGMRMMRVKEKLDAMAKI